MNGAQHWTGLARGADARELGRVILTNRRTHLHILSDAQRVEEFSEHLAFFHPDMASLFQVVVFPAWDCLPYDRLSPDVNVMRARLSALEKIREARAPLLILAPLMAAMQRVAPADAAGTKLLQKGSRVPRDNLIATLIQQGFHRAETVRAVGEYAVRGGILDLYLDADTDPLRLDFFGDEIESIRFFDPLTQRTTTPVEGIIRLSPVHEVVLSDAARTRFRHRYRDVFGSEATRDLIYEDIQAGRTPIGVEHWLPLFHAPETMQTIFDLLPPDAGVSADVDLDNTLRGQYEQILEYYAARQDSVARKNPPFRPIPPDFLYLKDEEFLRHLSAREAILLHSLAHPEATDFGTKSLIASMGTARWDNSFDKAVAFVREQQQATRPVVITAETEGSRERLRHLLQDHGCSAVRDVASGQDVATLPPSVVGLAVLLLDHGFISPDVTFLSEADIFGDRLHTRRSATAKRKSQMFIQDVSALHPHDLVVHEEHGIGRYDGLVLLDVDGVQHDCLKLVYAGGDRLFLPVENLDVLTRFGGEDALVQLDKLGGAAWQERKARVKKYLLEMAQSLMALAADRAVRQGEVMPKPDSYDEFCLGFPYAETADQARAIDEVLGDLASGKPMDRLVCGDVGFGKTEVALRAAFVAAMAGYQVAIIAPTTLLVRQHLHNFQKRFQKFPLRLAALSRMVSSAEAKQVKQALANGQVDIVIGTHALLSETLQFSNLGLVVVDEEQRFGVKQKERLKALKSNVHILTLTATPIPRTLQLSLTGVKDLSLIATPPVDRMAINTYTLPLDGVVVRDAILREKHRAGQVFYVVPRIRDIADVEEKLRQWVPDVRLATAHGQLSPDALEDVMIHFLDGRYDVLLCTDIIESGLDIPTANTIIIHRADQFGLAQLYQLRGRVGRAKIKAYCYFTVDPDRRLGDMAVKRLDVLQGLDHLGAGFALASHDMDIRGAGNLLGEEQSGQIREVGIELYQQMLESAIEERRATTAAVAVASSAQWSPEINVGLAVMIPDHYVADLGVRLSLYRRAADLSREDDVDAFAVELHDRFGSPPVEVQNLLHIIKLKILCRQAYVERLEAGSKGAVVTFFQNTFPQPEKLIAFIQKQGGSMKVRPDQKLVLAGGWETLGERLSGVRKMLINITDLLS